MNRALEKEIAAFVESLDFHLVHLIEKAMPYLVGESKANADAIVKRSMLDLWKYRNDFDPVLGSLPQFFGDIVRHNVKDMMRFRGAVIFWDVLDEERAVLDAINGVPSVYVARTDRPQWSTTKEKTKVDPVQKVGKECPPCWKCKYFWGWLPAQEYVPEKHSDPEVATACERIDRRKIAIAHWVRGDKSWSEAELHQE